MTKAEVRSQESGVRSKKLEARSKKKSCILNLASCILLFAVFSGCASHRGPAVLTPLPTPLPGYTVSGQKIVFSNNDVKIGILPLNSSELTKRLTGKDANNPLSEILTQPQYLAFLMHIENRSKAKIMYNPVLTTLFDKDMGFHKPLDYTDLYSLAGNLPNPEAALNNMKGLFYDVTVTLLPGQQTSRLLLFSGMEQGNSEVTIIMKEIYIGTSTIALSFGFKIEEEKQAGK